MRKIKVIDSHTGGEPTRIIVEGGPDLGDGPLAERVERFRNEFDEIRSAVVNEPRGSDFLVGGLLCEPTSPEFLAGIIFFNNAGYLGMCGHGTIGLIATLRHLGKIPEYDTTNPPYKIETPVGTVTALTVSNSEVAVQNVMSYRLLADVSIDVSDYGTFVGDVSWGGNWFFLVKDSSEKLVPQNAARLTQVTQAIRQSLIDNGITGTDGDEIDHIELFGAPHDSANHSRNFVLCPGGAYDRSPCGTGTSAKIACLAADGKLNENEIWRQESIVGSVFSASYQLQPGKPASDGIIPTVSGSAHVCAESTLLLNPSDPLCMGIRQ
ncbi:MAG: proline racemase family protein [Mariniblastus sp.]